MKRLVVGVLFAAACGSNGNGHTDAPVDTKVFMDAMPDGSAANPTFTSFVIDLVLNHNNDATPATFASFSALPDPDAGNATGVGENVHAYDSLF
jgi:hypothetical protein